MAPLLGLFQKQFNRIFPQSDQIQRTVLCFVSEYQVFAGIDPYLSVLGKLDHIVLSVAGIVEQSEVLMKIHCSGHFVE